MSDSFTAQCPRCGVTYPMRSKTIEKRTERGFNEWEMFICQDCKPTWVRKGRVTNDEIWEQYKKAMKL